MIHDACELIIDCLREVRFCVSVARLRWQTVKFVLEQTTKAQRGSRGIAILFL